MPHPLLKSVGDAGLYHRPRPLASPADWRLEVRQVRGGETRVLADLSLRDLEALAPRPLPLAIECVSAGRFTHDGERVAFDGIPFAQLLAHAYGGEAVPEDLRTVRFVSRAPATCGPKGERHWTSLALDVCCDEANGVALAVSLDGAPLPYLHGGPLRLVVGPRLFFYKAVKWLAAIELVTTPIDECRGTWEEYAGYSNLGWTGHERFEPRMRTIDRVVSEGDRAWDDSTAVP
ncbi:MAG TPA: molybdopterin-dependent oxidoreductase, partial [Thermoanaerobaculia bacterium]